MRHQVLPLPTGRYIIVESDSAGLPVLRNGAPVAYRGPVLNGQSGFYTWHGRELPATLCYWNARRANC